jgi:hypothetical protein
VKHSAQKPSEAKAPRSASRHALCTHGRRANICKDCGGSRICEHGRQKLHCRECPGPNCWCKHGIQKSKCGICSKD